MNEKRLMRLFLFWNATAWHRLAGICWPGYRATAIKLASNSVQRAMEAL